MFGFVVGIVCLVAFIGVWRGRFGRGFHRHHYRYRRGRHFGGGRYFGLYRLFEELDTSPGQEKAIRSALTELRSSATALRPHLRETQRSVSSAFSSEVFDGEALERSLDAHVSEASQLTRALVVAIGKTYEALDPDQRRRVARFVDALPYSHAC
jgi:Spy/CpxP family protein refolding chaperone